MISGLFTVIQEVHACPVCGEPHGMVTFPPMQFVWFGKDLTEWSHAARCPTSGLKMYLRILDNQVSVLGA